MYVYLFHHQLHSITVMIIIHVTANDVIKGLSMSTDEEVCNGLAAWSDPGRE